MKKNLSRPFLLIATVAVLFGSCVNSGSKPFDPHAPVEGEEHVHWITPGDGVAKQIVEALITAEDGATIYFGEGVFDFNQGLSIEGVKGLTLKGKGMDKTIFNFANQEDGAEGIKAENVTDFTVEGLAIVDAAGDGIKVRNSNGAYLRNMKVEWTTEGSEENGAYGIYPVSTKNVLVEGCHAIGASDAGIYLGQSENGIIRNNEVYKNVAGIEIENTVNAECYGNKVYNNTAGILVFDLPNLPKKNGTNVLVHHNEITDNNHPNFSHEGLSVSILPSGVGMLFMACQYVEAHNNTVTNNNAIGAAVVSLAMNTWRSNEVDEELDRFPSAVYIHDNEFSRETASYDMTRDLGQKFQAMFGDQGPMFVYEGTTNEAYLGEDGELTADRKVCFKNNKGEDLSFANITTSSTDLSSCECELPAIEPITFDNGVAL